MEDLMHILRGGAFLALLLAGGTPGDCQVSAPRTNALPQYGTTPSHAAFPMSPSPLVTGLPFGAGNALNPQGGHRIAAVAPNAADVASGMGPGMPGMRGQGQSVFSAAIIFRGR